MDASRYNHRHGITTVAITQIQTVEVRSTSDTTWFDATASRIDFRGVLEDSGCRRSNQSGTRIERGGHLGQRECGTGDDCIRRQTSGFQRRGIGFTSILFAHLHAFARIAATFAAALLLLAAARTAIAFSTIPFLRFLGLATFASPGMLLLLVVTETEP